jgi:hypothetical protein
MALTIIRNILLPIISHLTYISVKELEGFPDVSCRVISIVRHNTVTCVCVFHPPLQFMFCLLSYIMTEFGSRRNNWVMMKTI